ncbi:hypothetical protein FKM82_022544 [Ascaphus truei]|uniref:claudin-23 n=1 Tax=Ascaphus truei TaxID=8439 RepID=UPI003F5A098D
MRTPVAMIIGLVLAPCGLVLNLTSTVAPDWRLLGALNGQARDVVHHQGIWDICQESEATHTRTCGMSNATYFQTNVVQVARGLMVSSLVVTALGIVVASLGVRCWQEDTPNYLVSGFGGMVLFISGLLSLIAISFYNNQMYSPEMSVAGGATIQVGYSLVLGYLGSCLEIIGGFSLALSFVHSCNECMRNRSKTSGPAKYYSKNNPAMQGSRSKDTAHPSKVYSIGADHIQGDPNPARVSYSVANSKYQHDYRGRNANPTPRSYTNPMDVTEGEHPRRPGSQLSSLPCDSDLL